MGSSGIGCLILKLEFLPCIGYSLMFGTPMHRTPKNYDGIAPPARTIREMLPEVLSRIQKTSGAGASNVMEAWPSIIGSKMSSMTRVLSFEKGVLTVLVRSSSLYSLLCQHEKPRLLSMLQEQFPKNQVRDIFFRIG